MADKLAVGLVSRTYFNMPLWIGLEHGFFAAEGIEIDAPILGNKPQGPPLLDGSLSFSSAAPRPSSRTPPTAGRSAWSAATPASSCIR